MDDDGDGLGRYAGAATLILSSLAAGAQHGYGLIADIEGFAGERLQPGTRYGALTRLEQDGLIEDRGAWRPTSAVGGAAPHRGRRTAASGRRVGDVVKHAKRSGWCVGPIAFVLGVFARFRARVGPVSADAVRRPPRCRSRG